MQDRLHLALSDHTCRVIRKIVRDIVTEGPILIPGFDRSPVPALFGCELRGRAAAPECGHAPGKHGEQNEERVSRQRSCSPEHGFILLFLRGTPEGERITADAPAGAADFGGEKWPRRHCKFCHSPGADGRFLRARLRIELCFEAFSKWSWGVGELPSSSSTSSSKAERRRTPRGAREIN